MTYQKLITECYHELKQKLKNLDVCLNIKDNDGEHVLSWEWMSKNLKKETLSEFDILEKYAEEINFADRKLLEIATFCESKKITYSLKVCKMDKLQKDNKDPGYLTSYISIGFPSSAYYESRVNDDIPDTSEEFEKRKNAGLI